MAHRSPHHIQQHQHDLQDFSCSGPPSPARLQLTTARHPSRPQPTIVEQETQSAPTRPTEPGFAFGCGTTDLLQVAHQGSVQQLLEPVALIHAVAGTLHVTQLTPQPLNGCVGEPSCGHLLAVEKVRWPLQMVPRDLYVKIVKILRLDISVCRSITDDANDTKYSTSKLVASAWRP